jgi:signal recognition particle receptor subunit beta
LVQDVLSLLRPNEGRRQTPSYTGLASLLPKSPPPVRTAEPIGLELKRLIETLAQCARELRTVSDAALSSHIKEVLDRSTTISSRIALVGQVKAGKSSFINALIQHGELLPTHVNPWTAVATQLHFGTPKMPVSGCDFTFFDRAEWEALGTSAMPEEEAEADTTFAKGFDLIKKRAETRLGDKFHHLLGKTHYYETIDAGTLQNYICAGPPVEEVSRNIKPGRYADITKSANIYFPLAPFAVPAILIDTPGTNDPTHIRLRITRQLIEGADIYIVVLAARQPLAAADMELLRLLRGLEKSRIIVFINRIDELADPVSDADAIVRHVRGTLAAEFGGLSIPVVAGSARWAGLANSNDIDALEKEAEQPAFRAVALQRTTLALTHAHGGLEDLQKRFRAASGLDSVRRLISTFMLSAFASSHASAIANVLLSAADILAATARHELKSITAILDDAKREDYARPDGADSVTQYIAEIEVLLNTVSNCITSLTDEYASTIDRGAAALETKLDADIQAFAAAQRVAFENAWKAGQVRGGWTCDVEPLRRKIEQDFAEVTGETSDRLILVQEAALAFIQKTLVETSLPAEQDVKPVGVRAPRLVPPLTAIQHDVSIDGENSWWSGLRGTRKPDPKKAEQLVDIIEQEFAPIKARLVAAVREEMQSFAARSSETIALTATASLTKLAQKLKGFRAVQLTQMHDEKGRRLADFAEQYDAAINQACLTIATCDRVIQQINALFQSTHAMQKA